MEHFVIGSEGSLATYICYLLGGISIILLLALIILTLTVIRINRQIDKTNHKLDRVCRIMGHYGRRLQRGPAAATATSSADL